MTMFQVNITEQCYVWRRQRGFAIARTNAVSDDSNAVVTTAIRPRDIQSTSRPTCVRVLHCGLNKQVSVTIRLASCVTMNLIAFDNVPARRTAGQPPPIVSSCRRSNSPLSAAELFRLPLPPSGTRSLNTSSKHLLYSHFNIIWKLSCSDVHFRTFFRS